MLSSIVPEPYQTVYKDGQPLYDAFKSVIVTLGRLDFALRALPGMSRVGYAAILVAEKPLSV